MQKLKRCCVYWARPHLNALSIYLIGSRSFRRGAANPEAEHLHLIAAAPLWATRLNESRSGWREGEVVGGAKRRCNRTLGPRWRWTWADGWIQSRSFFDSSLLIGQSYTWETRWKALLTAGWRERKRILAFSNAGDVTPRGSCGTFCTRTPPTLPATGTVCSFPRSDVWSCFISQTHKI